jgi:predicted RNA-binding Zn ribbon-like protein
MNALWIEFINSDWHDYTGRGPDRDRLDEPDWIRSFLADWNLPSISCGEVEVVSALQDLRSLLQRFVSTLVADGPLQRDDVAMLNQYLTARPVTPTVEVADESFRLRLTPESEGIDAVLFAIAESFAAFLIEGEPDRLKTCENPDCRWVFYDTTRSRTRRWCADSCGNLMKVRRFRKKKSKTGKKKRKR